MASQNEKENDQVLEDDEEILVLVELAGVIDNDFGFMINDNYKVLGIDSEHPVIQIGHYVFSGEYRDSPGSLIMFEETPANDNKKSTGDKELKLKCIVQKKLAMKRAFLKDQNIPPSLENKSLEKNS